MGGAAINGGAEGVGPAGQGGGGRGSAYKRRLRLVWGLLAPESDASLPELRMRVLRGAVVGHRCVKLPYCAGLHGRAVSVYRAVHAPA